MIIWTLSRRIALGFTLVVAVTSCIGLLSMNRIQQIDAEAQVLTSRELPSITVLGRIQSTIKGNYINCCQHIETSDPKVMAAIDAEMKQKSELLTGLYKEIEALLGDDETKAQYETIKAARSAYRDAREKVLVLSRAGKSEEARKANFESLYPVYLTYISKLEAQAEINRVRADNAGRQAQEVIKDARLIVQVGNVLALAFAAFLGWFITRRINRVIGAVSQELDDASRQVSSASGLVSNSSQTLAQGSSEQAASLEETSSSLEEISSMTQRNAASAQSAKDLSNQTRQAAEQGAGDVEAMTKAMDAIKDSSSNIAKIIKTIDEIAFQTNILALNAAVEAARAGEAGAGFAVVAEEVRALAQRSAQAAKETATNIEDSITKSGHGVEISDKVARSLQEIVGKAREVDHLIGEIAMGSGEQANGIRHVLEAVTKIDSVTQGNAASAEEAAAAAEELNAQAHTLASLVQRLHMLVSGAQASASKD